jgi:hypothetical protein
LARDDRARTDRVVSMKRRGAARSDTSAQPIAGLMHPEAFADAEKSLERSAS